MLLRVCLDLSVERVLVLYIFRLFLCQMCICHFCTEHVLTGWVVSTAREYFLRTASEQFAQWLPFRILHLDWVSWLQKALLDFQLYGLPAYGTQWPCLVYLPTRALHALSSSEILLSDILSSSIRVTLIALVCFELLLSRVVSMRVLSWKVCIFGRYATSIIIPPTFGSSLLNNKSNNSFVLSRVSSCVLNTLLRGGVK